MDVASMTGIRHEVATDLGQQSGRRAGWEGGEIKDKLLPEAGIHEGKLELASVFHHPQPQGQDDLHGKANAIYYGAA